MDRTTIFLPTELKILVNSYIQNAGISFSEFLRLSIERSLNEKLITKEKKDSFFSDRAVYTKKVPSDLSKNHNHYLYS